MICDESSQTLPKELIPEPEDDFEDEIYEEEVNEEINEEPEESDEEDEGGTIDDFNQFLMDLLGEDEDNESD